MTRAARRRALIALAALPAAALGACFNPSYDDPACSPAGECPDGLTCVQGTCVRPGSGIDAADPDARIDAPDASIDAPMDVCGDNTRTGGEACDDGNTVTETECPYGTAFCVRCNADCTMALDLTGNVCGDGVVATGFEACDDNNTLACGTCSADCQTVITAAAATGSISAITGSDILDGEGFLIDDGFGTIVTFEFDRNMFVQPNTIPVSYQTGQGPGQIADAITAAVNSTMLRITAAHVGGPTVILNHDRLSALGNRAIMENVVNVSFTVQGMSGGAAGNCPSGTTCRSDLDCTSGACPPSMICQ